MSQSNSDMTNTLALLDRMKGEMPEIWEQTQVVGSWLTAQTNQSQIKRAWLPLERTPQMLAAPVRYPYSAIQPRPARSV